MYGRKSIRKRPLFQAQSVSSDTEDDKSLSTGRGSPTSKKSAVLSLRSDKKSTAGSLGVLRPDTKWLKVREYLLLLIEASLSLAVYVISERNYAMEETMRLNLTGRQSTVNLHYAEGYSALVSMFIGCIADSWMSHYTLALLSVILHFAAVSVVFVEDTIKENMETQPYAPIVWPVCVAAVVLIKSTDFIRLVYGLEGMTNRTTSTVWLFIFFQFWVSSYSTYGGIFANAFSFLFNFFKFDVVSTCFVMCGLSLFIFVYLLHPEGHTKEHKGLGCGVVFCLLLASYYKAFGITKRGKKGCLDNTEGKCTKTTISRTKEILLLYALLLPALGTSLKVIVRGNVFYEKMIKSIKTDEDLQIVGHSQIVRASLTIAMLLSYFGLWPLLTILGVRNKQTNKFLVGHLIAVVSLFYAAFLTKKIDKLEYPSGSGFVRVFNTRETPVKFISDDGNFSTHDFDVVPKKGVMVAYPCSKVTLFPMRVSFTGDDETNFTMFLSVMPRETIGYIVLDPPEVIRIRGPYLPMQEGPPGTNRKRWGKVFIYNTAPTLVGTAIKINSARQRKTVREVEIPLGIMTTIALKPAMYDFTISQADINKTLTIGEGALYGMMVYATTSSREMEIDEIIGSNTASIWPLAGMYFVSGLAKGLSYPSLRAIVFTIAPHGLMSMSFAFIAFLEGISLWFMYIGFRTWHHFVTADVLFVYASIEFTFFLLCMFVLLKYNDSYIYLMDLCFLRVQ